MSVGVDARTLRGADALMRVLVAVVLSLLALACVAGPRADAELEFELAARRGLDIKQPMHWSYSIDSVPSDRLRPLLDSLRQLGLDQLDVPELDAENDAGIHAVWIVETRVHTVETYAMRLKQLATVAGDHGAVLDYWSVSKAEEVASSSALPLECAPLQARGAADRSRLRV